jgi:hypothetical protein
MADNTQPPAPRPPNGKPDSDPSARAEPVNLAAAEIAAQEEAAPAPAGSPAPPEPPLPDAGRPQEAGDPIAQLAAIAKSGNQTRLSPSDEDRATRLMRDAIRLGPAGVTASLDAMPQLPWILGVRAIETTWPELGGDARAQILEGLAKMETDSGFRLRLSLARSLSKAEMPVAITIAADAARAMWKHDNGTLTAEHSKLIGNVFIGRGKPWVVQLPLAGLGEAEANAILSCVVFSAFNINNPPITQLSILRYVGGRLEGLHENLLAMVGRGVGRWGGKWQAALRKEVPDLPESILGALKSDRPAEHRRPADDAAPETSGESPDTGAATAGEVEDVVPPELEEKLRLASESGDPAAVETVTQEINAWREAQRVARLEALDNEDEDDEEEEDSEESAGEIGRADQGRDRRGRRGRDRNERPAYVPRDQEARGAPGFNFGAAMKQLDNYVAGLRNELAAAQTRLRRVEDEARRTRRESADRPVLSHEEANLSPDELRRLVIQLENRAAELKTRVEELTADSEARALAMAAGTSEPSPDAVTQLRTLLALKLQDDFADFLALEKESPDFVVQQHYRGLIRHVFQILADEKVPLRVPEEPVVVPPLPPQIPG